MAARAAVMRRCVASARLNQVHPAGHVAVRQGIRRKSLGFSESWITRGQDSAQSADVTAQPDSEVGHVRRALRHGRIGIEYQGNSLASRHQYVSLRPTLPDTGTLPDADSGEGTPASADA